MGSGTTGRSAERNTMDFVEAWVREHINASRYRASDDDARAREMARWLQKDAAGCGISGADIDRAIDATIGAAHGLVPYITEAMAAVSNTTVPNPEASRLAGEDI